MFEIFAAVVIICAIFHAAQTGEVIQSAFGASIIIVLGGALLFFEAPLGAGIFVGVIIWGVLIGPVLSITNGRGFVITTILSVITGFVVYLFMSN